MEFPKWFNKFIYWISLILLLIVIIIIRAKYFNLNSPMDFVLILILFVLLLLPLFEEISIFGLRFKRELDSLRTDLKGQIINLRSEIQNSINIRNETTQNIIIPGYISDEQIKKIEENRKNTLGHVLSDKGIVITEEPLNLEVEDEVQYLFKVRYNIEKEIRRIYDNYIDIPLDEKQKKRFSVLRMLIDLRNFEIIDSRSFNIIREILSACNPAIHGESVSSTRVNFVKDLSPELITLLRNI